MIEYVILLIIVMLLSFIIHSIKLKNKNLVLVIVVFSLLWFFQSIRSISVGTDIASYLRVYKELPYTSWNQLFDNRMEFGFMIYLKILSTFGVGEQLLLSIFSATILFPVAVFIYKNSRLPFWSILAYLSLGFYLSSFCTIRQNISYSLVLLSYSMIKDKKLLRFILTIIFASLFHVSSLVFIPAYFVYKIKINIKNLIAYFVIFILLFIFKSDIGNLVTKYIFTDYNLNISNSYNWMILSIVTLTLMLITTKHNKIDFGIFNIVIFGILLMNFISVFSNAIRVIDYYYIFIILALPYSVDNSNLRIKNILKVSYLFYLVFIFIYFIANDQGYGLTPYEFFWNLI